MTSFSADGRGTHPSCRQYIGPLWSCSVALAISWNVTEYMFVFGDSYTTDAYNVVLLTTSDGPNWVQFLSKSKEKSPYSTSPTHCAVCSESFASVSVPVVDLVTHFNKYLASRPASAAWSSTNSLFAAWIGINDVARMLRQFHVFCMLRFNYADEIFRLGGITEVEDLYLKGARSFSFPVHPSSPWLTLHTQPIYNALLYERQTFSSVNVTGTAKFTIVALSLAHTYWVAGGAPM
ncbi:hypothetical protein BDR03DRAFT_986284 [Suillus americanus]|nr:hypothetical protein BDR03DRAFT_986284 [Suillus americanus]